MLVTCFVIGAEMAVGAAVGWRADRPRLPLSVSRWREPIRDLWSLGRVPGRGFFNDDIVPASELEGERDQGLSCNFLFSRGRGQLYSVSLYVLVLVCVRFLNHNTGMLFKKKVI